MPRVLTAVAVAACLWSGRAATVAAQTSNFAPIAADSSRPVGAGWTFTPALVYSTSWDDNVLIVMDAEQTLAVCQFSPQSTVVAIHLDSLDHGTVSRASLHAAATARSITAPQLLIPQDGETLTFAEA